MTGKDYFDSTGNIFIKLYKKVGDKMFYWESWNVDDKTATIHWGQLGTQGEQQNLVATSQQELKDQINTLIAGKKVEGYEEMPIGNEYTIAVTFKLKSWGTPEDLDRREELRTILSEHLGWTGNGRCDDGDIGSGEMTLFADVVDPYIAIKTISQEFNAQNVNDEYYFIVTQGDKMIINKVIPDR